MTEKKNVVEYVTTKVPRYTFVDQEIKVPKLVEVPVEGISKNDLDLLKAYGRELKDIYTKLEQIKNYRIVTEDIRIKRPSFEDEIIKRPIFKDELIKVNRYVEKEKEIEIPVPVEIPVEVISREDLEFIKETIIAIRELMPELQKLRNYKIQEENLVVEKPIYKPKVVEIDSEKVNWIVSDKVIETIEDLLKELKRKGGFK